MKKGITADSGFYYGIGAFETIALCDGVPMLLNWHLERLQKSLDFFGIRQKVTEKEVLRYLAENHRNKAKREVLKITVTEQNKLFTMRQNTYTKKQYERGFRLDFSKILRNETSPLTFHKTLASAENILEKRDALQKGIDEKIFLNGKKEICEGCTTNLFFLAGEKLLTPTLRSGMLPGVMRRYVLEKAEKRGLSLEECILYPKDLEKMDACFVTNSLLGMMPVFELGAKHFDVKPVKVLTAELLQEVSEYFFE